MSEKRKHIQHYHSQTKGAKPTPESLFLGELSVNTADETIMFKNNSGEIVEIKPVDTLIEISYSNLVNLRRDRQLIPGVQYRITDYVTTTIQENTQSAGHQFDIIVTATDESTLSENARAAIHDGDTYFAENGANLDAWEIKYALDNDTEIFYWADTTNGKGVIYYMKDEWNNECPYDFKNIMFLRGLYADGGLIPYHEPNGDEDLTAYCYTFGWLNEDSTMLDVTIFGNNGTLLTDEGQIDGVYGNIIKANFYYEEYIDNPTNVQQRLNNIVFLATYYYYDGFFYGFQNNSFENNCYYNSFGGSCSHNSFENNCSSNSFGNYCDSNSFENNCYYNSFGGSCSHNSFGSSCSRNSFVSYCNSNSFGDVCKGNSFGDECINNSFGNSCKYNSFGSSCSHNSFGNDCASNSFGNRCKYNSFGSSCSHNSFGNSYVYNSFGNRCSSNSFGDECQSNSFGNSCYHNSFRNRAGNTSGPLSPYCYYNHFDDGCSYNVIWNSDTKSSSVPLKNINVNRGVRGTSNSYNMININTINSEQEINVNQVDGIISIGDILSIKYESLKILRDNSQLIPGRQYRIIDYVTTTSQSNTQSAGHQFDIIVTALDECTLSEEAHAIQNINDGYFDETNLSAWKLWYCLDNDTNRFAWAGDEKVGEIEHKYYDSSECTINSELIDGNSFITPFNFESCVWVDVNNDGYVNRNNHDIDELIYEWGYFTDDNDNTHLCLYKSNADIYEEEGQPDYGDKYLYRGVVNVDGEEYDYWQKWDNDGEDVTIPNPGGYVYATTTRIVSNPDAFITTIETEDSYKPGKGVIYRMIDEFNNDCPYDFKNIIYVFNKSFMYNQWGTDSEFIRDSSIDKVINETQYYGYVTDNLPTAWSEGKCWVTDEEVTVNSRLYKEDGSVISYGGTIFNISNEESESFTFNEGELNDFSLEGEFCYGNTIMPWVGGLNRIVFKNDKTYEYQGQYIHNCYSNSFGNNCYYNSFGNNCYSNSFGDYYYLNTFGNNCYSNSFGNNCNSNSFGDYYYLNTFGSNCDSNSFGNNCDSNSFGNGCDSNSFGNNCDSNSFGNNCYSNSFGNNCYSNSFGNNCYSNSFGNNCDSNSFGNGCIDNRFNISWAISNSLKSYCENNHFDDGCSYNVIWNSDTTSTTIKLKNVNVNRGVVGTNSSYNFINIGLLNSEQEINVNQVDGIISIGDILSIKYESLKTLRDNAQLIPGQQYRIINYVTIISQANTQSAIHPFDVIVLATSENTLSEEARAIQHDGDEYFNTSNLDAWKIWYSLDNDTDKFTWADVTSGKGVIYRMIDEFNNDCPYDFKNIQFKHPKDTTTYPDYYYTFSTVIDGTVTDHSMLRNYCRSNTMKEYITDRRQNLNYNVFLNTSKTSGCRLNSFGRYCHNNSFGDNCYNNSFGDGCYNNSFGHYCQHISFRNTCHSNSFGYGCLNNSFGNRCLNNSFGNNYSYNSFGNGCLNNSFGNDYSYNSFGNGCSYNTFRVSADTSSALKDHAQYNHFDDGCSYNVIWNSGTTSTTIKLKNVNVNRGVCGTSNSYNIINIQSLNSEKEININNYNGHIHIDYGDIFKVTYSELVTLRDNSQLIPGRQYRIIDYVTTTNQANTQSAGHQFDVIVLAISENTLSEEARAIQHDGDEYFNTSNLDAWKIWYSLDNDTDKFAWADTTNGKGVIYHMIDEFNNDCPYDFKNIQFKHPTDTTTYPDYYYTFSTVIDGVVTDHSMLQGYCYGNIMKEYINSEKQSLNYNVFLNTSKTNRCYSNSFGNNCYNNTFGLECYNNSFGKGCFNNSFGNGCYNNSFGNECISNSLANFCYSNSFGNQCRNFSLGNSDWCNSFGNYCVSNSLASNCYFNSFGNGCNGNSFGSYCVANSFGNDCNNNSFSYYCSSNSFGNNCRNNSFGGYCVNNLFGNGCYYNSFRKRASKTGTLKDYVRNNHFDDGCSYNVIWNSSTTSSNIWLKNINVNRGVVGTNSSYNFINIEVLNQDYEIQVAKNSNGEIKIYCEADLIL